MYLFGEKTVNLSIKGTTLRSLIMFYRQNILQISIYKYFETIFNVICRPSKTFKDLSISYHELICYLILSAWLYAIISCHLRTLSSYLLLILSPISIIPHTLLTGLVFYLIFIKLFKARGSFEECLKIASYIFIGLLPIMTVTFIKNSDNIVLFLIKALPFLYFLVLTYKASKISFPSLRINKLIQGNVLASLINLCVSTLVFSINMIILSFINSKVFDHSYVWKIYYN